MPGMPPTVRRHSPQPSMEREAGEPIHRARAGCGMVAGQFDVEFAVVGVETEDRPGVSGMGAGVDARQVGGKVLALQRSSMDFSGAVDQRDQSVEMLDAIVIGEGRPRDFVEAVFTLSPEAARLAILG